MRRFFRILKWIGLTVVTIVSAVLIVFAVHSAMADARLQKKIVALRAAGEPVSLPDLARKPIPPDENAATYLNRAKQDLEAIERKLIEFEATLPQADQDAFDNGEPVPKMTDWLRAILADYPQAFELLEQAANCPDYDAGWDFNVDSNAFLEAFLDVGEVRRPARTLGYRVAVQLADRQLDEALHTCVISLRLARHFDRNPMIMGEMVAIACRGRAIEDAQRVLQAGAVSPDANEALELELAQHDLFRQFRESLRSERAFGIQQYRWLTSQIAGGWLTPPWFKNSQGDYLDTAQLCMAAAERPSWEWENQIEADKTSQRVDVLVGMWLATIQAHHNATTRGQALLNSLRVLNAIVARQAAGDLGEPILEHLGLPAEATIDPFNGQPLHVKKLADRWAVYSVGKDLIDDGGVYRQDTDGPDVGLGLQRLPDEPTEPEKEPDTEETGTEAK